MSRIPIPEKFDANEPNKRRAWERFLQSWQNYEVAADVCEMPENKRLASFLTVIGSEAVEVYNTFSWNSSENKTVETTISKFKEFYEPEVNLTYERYKFLTRKQKQTESISDFIVELKKLANNCNYENLKDCLLCDALVIGVHDNSLRESLLRDSNLTLEKALNTALAFENARKQIDDLEKQEPHEKVFSIGKKNADNEEVKAIKIKCKFWNQNHVSNRSKCPAYGKNCFKCGRKNHFSTVCRNEENFDNSNGKMMSDQNSEEDEISVHYIN